ncbi:cobaltochelatase CobN subunit [Azonexus fungiphilus]|uniref:Cobaltochelatase CobN subunit n=1 Tax=Azonexus fungiphilus TaxID=146940 RepID=A0A495WAQ1_9RHOO|nr:cobaltochelatase subunit CobN [Azonexus fungiphilus]RKT58220.1 cobaltochelatase CobN subunit [Azonexus fungiphilus]
MVWGKSARRLLVAAFSLAAAGVQAASLLWVTADITPAARSALVERLAVAQGWQFRQLDHALNETPALLAGERAELGRALAAADMVWIDAPHPSVRARLDKLFAGQTAARAVWIEERPLAGGTTLPARLAEYLSHGGEANIASALRLASAWVAGTPPPELPPAQAWPVRGLYHPDAPGIFADTQALTVWQSAQPALRDRPAVAVLVHRHHFINAETGWLDAWLRRFAERGLFAYAVFAQQLEAATLERLVGADGKPHPRVVVLHQLVSQTDKLQALFERWGVPLLATQPYRHGDVGDWAADPTGLKLSDAPFYLVQPEAAGAIDPLVVTAHADGGRRTLLIERQADAVVAKAARLIRLATMPPAARRVVAMVYNYPPGGSNFGASFLNVPRSLETVSGGLAAAGYNTRQLPEDDWIAGLQPLLRAYYADADLRDLLASGQAAALPLRAYLAWWQTLPAALRARIEARWGAPASSRYVVHWQGQPVFVIPRLAVGNFTVLPQPPREETLHRGENPFMHRSRQPLSHHYLAVYLWARQADALIHFGTHGTQEWAPGKSRGLDVLDDALLPLGDVPVIYPYIVDNLGEALTAKRRGRALLISHRTPVFATTGLAAGMAELHDLMHEWAIADRGPTREAIGDRLTQRIVEGRLHHDLNWSAERVRSELDAFLEILHPWLDQLAHGSQPRGLAVFGQAPDAALRRQTILQALRTPLLDALGEDVDETFLMDHRKVVDSRPMRWLEVALRDAAAASRLDLRPPQPDSAVPNRAAERRIDREALFALAERAQELDRLLAVENELPALLAALDGRFIPAAYGGDPVRNPDSLPTGRNLTGLDPSRLPTQQAYTVAELMFDNWLQAWRAGNGGRYPTRLALSLWAGETLRHQGIMEAQALVALGVRPVWDKSGRPRGVAVIPAGELGRPRVDVLLSVTGSYRDQFPALMALVDSAVAAVAAGEPEGTIARNSRDTARELRRQGVAEASAELLGQARVFGNLVGDYGTGIADAVQDDRLRVRDERLGAMFLQRMGQPFLGGVPVAGIAAGDGARALAAGLRRTDAALLSRTSNLFGMVTSDDPFQYLGGLAAAARSAGRAGALPLYVNQLQNADEPYTQTAAQSVALEMQARYLHPGWAEAMKAEGYAGTLQVLKAAQFTWGWQSVTDGVVRPDHWQGLYDVFVRDRHGLDLPAWLRSHPQAYAQTLERLIQAQRQGHWQPDAATRKELAGLYAELTRQAPLVRELAGVRRWVDGQLGVPPAPAPAAVAVAAAETQPPATAASVAPAYVPVRGQVMAPVAPTPDVSPVFRWLALLTVIFALAGGAVQQWERGRQR